MRITIQKLLCADDRCDAFLELHLGGEHDLLSTAAALEAVSIAAGWGKGYCPTHVPPATREERERQGGPRRRYLAITTNPNEAHR